MRKQIVPDQPAPVDQGLFVFKSRLIRDSLFAFINKCLIDGLDVLIEIST